MSPLFRIVPESASGDLIKSRIQYRKENDRLRQAAHAASREVKERQQNIEKLEQEAEEHTQELADLRELVFNQQNGEYEKDTPDTMGRKKSAPP